MKFPEYETIAGQRYLAGSLCKNDIRIRIDNTNIDECREYAIKLEKLGFEKCSKTNCLAVARTLTIKI